MNYKFIKVPTEGDKIFFKNSEIDVPDHPIIPFIEGDGTGPDIWFASKMVFDEAVKKAYNGKKKIAWMEIYAGEKTLEQISAFFEADQYETRIIGRVEKAGEKKLTIISDEGEFIF